MVSIWREKGKPGETTTVVIVTSAVFAKTTAVTIDYNDDKSAPHPIVMRFSTNKNFRKDKKRFHWAIIKYE